nr:LysR family transcriptional regulator [Desulfohalovibrio reitneri]
MISLNFSHLQCFVAAAETGSFSAAGRLLGKAQSGVSTAVANLEIDLGTRLFDRSRKYLRLTEEGEVLLRDAVGIVQGGERLKDRALSFCAEEDTHIRLALDEGVHSQFVEQFLAPFESGFPFTELDLQTGIFNDVEECVASGKADLGLLISSGIPKRLEAYKLLSYVSFHAVAAADHPLTGKEAVTISDLEDERQLVVTSRGDGKDTEVTHFSPKRWLVDSYGACASLVERGMGWAFFPATILNDPLVQRNIQQISLELEIREHASPLYLIRNKNRKVGKAGRWLLRKLGEYAM